MIRSSLDSSDAGASVETSYHVWDPSENFFQANNARRFNIFHPLVKKGWPSKLKKFSFKQRFSTRGRKINCRDLCRPGTSKIRSALDTHGPDVHDSKWYDTYKGLCNKFGDHMWKIASWKKNFLIFEGQPFFNHGWKKSWIFEHYSPEKYFQRFPGTIMSFKWCACIRAI